MDKVREDGYFGAIGTGIFGALMLLAGWNLKFSDLTGQGCGVIGIFFIV